MYESADIVKYLFKTYGPGESKIPFLLKGSVLATMLSAMGKSTYTTSSDFCLLIYLFSCSIVYKSPPHEWAYPST